jgi:hypothetical protein
MVWSVGLFSTLSMRYDENVDAFASATISVRLRIKVNPNGVEPFDGKAPVEPAIALSVPLRSILKTVKFGAPPRSINRQNHRA